MPVKMVVGQYNDTLDFDLVQRSGSGLWRGVVKIDKTVEASSLLSRAPITRYEGREEGA
jgi:hypothetical protein